MNVVIANPEAITDEHADAWADFLADQNHELKDLRKQLAWQQEMLDELATEKAKAAESAEKKRIAEMLIKEQINDLQRQLAELDIAS
jgi:hypothetical protein